MNNTLVDFLYDLGVELTYELHESGDIDYVKYVDNYFDCKGIDVEKYKQTFNDFCKYHITENNGWFSEKEDVTRWYLNYLKIKNNFKVKV